MTEYVYATDEHEGHWLTGEQIVRCRDCRFFEIDTFQTGGRLKYCRQWVRFGFWDVDNFCSRGERIDDEKELEKRKLQLAGRMDDGEDE